MNNQSSISFGISIITVTLNQRDNLLSTINSVQKFKDANPSFLIEHIIVDGKSNDGTLEMLNNCNSSILKYISEKDNGIYQAMNKGVGIAKYIYIIFINAGDLVNLREIDFKFSEKLNVALKDQKIGGFAFNSFYQIGIILRKVVARSIDPNKPQMPSLHQGMLYKRKLLIDIPFNENLKICGDFEQFARMKQKGLYFKPIDVIFSTLYAGGISSKKPLLLFKESTWITSSFYNLSFFTSVKTRFNLIVALALVQVILIYSNIVSLFYNSNTTKNNG